jgi:hypothetical protein
MKPESADIENNENNPILNTLLQVIIKILKLYLKSLSDNVTKSGPRLGPEMIT